MWSNAHIVEHYQALLQAAGCVLTDKAAIGVKLTFQTNQPVGESGIYKVPVCARQEGESIGQGQISLNVRTKQVFTEKGFARPIVIMRW